VKFVIKYISILLFSLYLSLSAHSQCEVLSDFNDYSIYGMSTTIQWNPSNTYSVVCNSSDWQPSFFVNKDSLLNVKISGDIFIPSATNDDDFVGFIFGYKSPNASSPSNLNNYYLFDWRKNDQYAPTEFGGNLALEGYNLSYVEGVIESDPVNTYKYFWGHEESNVFVPLDHQYSNS